LGVIIASYSLAVLAKGRRMNSVLLVLAVLSVVAVVIATYVFTVAARNYVSDSADDIDRAKSYGRDDRAFIKRSAKDRRREDNVIQFPITLINGEVVSYDRRVGDRREVG